MKNLPKNFLVKLKKHTGVNPSNLSRYLSGNVTPRPDRARELSAALKKEGVILGPEEFFLNAPGIKNKIIEQLVEVA